MYKFLEWLSGYYSGLTGVNFAQGTMNFIDGYAYGYQKGEMDSGLYGHF